MKLLKKLLFIDIETVPLEPTYDKMSKNMQEFWTYKSSYILPTVTPSESYVKKAGTYAEFAKIVAIGFGFFRKNDAEETEFRVKSIYHKNEKQLLEDFCDLLEKFKKETILVGHHAKEFDFPFLCRRMLVHRLHLPALLQLQGRKPWEVKHIDTMEMWKFGDHKKFTPLALLAELFGIEAKVHLDDQLIYKLYYQTQGYADIATHCQDNVILTAQIYLALRNYQRLEPHNIIISGG